MFYLLLYTFCYVKNSPPKQVEIAIDIFTKWYYKGDLRNCQGSFLYWLPKTWDKLGHIRYSTCKQRSSESKPPCISLLKGDSRKLISLNILFLGIKSHLRAPMVWKIFLIQFHFENGDEKI